MRRLVHLDEMVLSDRLMIMSLIGLLLAESMSFFCFLMYL
jgi:hypothetical protein